MLTSEEHFTDNWEPWFNEPFNKGKIHSSVEREEKLQENMLVHEYLNIKVEEETGMVNHRKILKCETSPDLLLLHPENFVAPDCAKPEKEEFENQKKQKFRAESRLLQPRLPFSFKETEKVVKKREQNRKRKALRRAQETEEQKSLRRERERLAKAALRATETIEKRLVRRERDRVAKAISRAIETDEQRKARREKNRKAMAAMRASQTEEERFIRREKDRIKKATIRAFETEEQRRIRREKNRVAMALRRANLNAQERNYFKLSFRNSNKTCLPNFISPILKDREKNFKVVCNFELPEISKISKPCDNSCC